MISGSLILITITLIKVWKCNLFCRTILYYPLIHYLQYWINYNFNFIASTQLNYDFRSTHRLPVRWHWRASPSSPTTSLHIPWPICSRIFDVQNVQIAKQVTKLENENQKCIWFLSTLKYLSKINIKAECVKELKMLKGLIRH